MPVNFANQVVPIFTKFGCNAGGCHGKAGGQNGFKLSLLGFEPDEDYEYLVKEARGRRLFPAAPEQQPAAAQGDRRSRRTAAASGSTPTRRSTACCAAGSSRACRYGTDDRPGRRRASRCCRASALMDRGGQQQLAVIAHYTDGSTRDVTRMTQFEPNDTEHGRGRRRPGWSTHEQLPGDVAVMARYQAQVDVFRATVPLGAPVDEPAAGEELHRRAGLQAAEGARPAAVGRRATTRRSSAASRIDIAGRLPTPDEAEAFLADTDADKREKLIDRLLGSDDYADYFANKWSAVLRNRRKSPTGRPEADVRVPRLDPRQPATRTSRTTSSSARC